MKCYCIWQWILVAFLELSVITGILPRWWRQTFRMPPPPRRLPGRVAVECWCCRNVVVIIWLGGRIQRPTSSFVGVFVFPMLSLSSSAMYWTFLPVLPPLHRLSGVFSYLCVLPVLLLVPFGSCVLSPSVLLVSPMMYISSQSGAGYFKYHITFLAVLRMHKQRS